MALNIHSDRAFERRLSWLSRHLRKTKTDIIKELVLERYKMKKAGFQFGALRAKNTPSSAKIRQELKTLDTDHDLD